MSRDPRGLWLVFRWPLVIGALTLAGLVAALVGDGPWDLFGWIVLAPAVVLAIDGLRRAWRRPR